MHLPTTSVYPGQQESLQNQQKSDRKAYDVRFYLFSKRLLFACSNQSSGRHSYIELLSESYPSLGKSQPGVVISHGMATITNS